MCVVIELHNPISQEDYTFFITFNKGFIGWDISKLIRFIQDNDKCIFVRDVYFRQKRYRKSKKKVLYEK